MTSWASLRVADGRLAHVALQARHDGLDRCHARLGREVRQFAQQALLLMHDAGEAGEFVLEADAEIAGVGGFLDQRTRDGLHFVVLVKFQGIEAAPWRWRTACSLWWRAATPRISTVFSSSNRRFWMVSVADRSVRASGCWRISIPARTPAESHGDFADHAHQVVQQLRGHLRHRPEFGSRLR